MLLCVSHPLPLVFFLLPFYTENQLWELIVGGVAIGMLAALFGFVVAMRTSPSFNQRVRSTAMFVPLTNTHNKYLRKSLALPTLGDEYDELVRDDDNNQKGSRKF
jgi:hypothetical protein